MIPNPRLIGLVLSQSHGYCRDILRALRSYAETRQDWVFTPIDPEGYIDWLHDLRPAGIIAHIWDRRLARALATIHRPVVNVSGLLPDLPFPRVGTDDATVGRLAATHLLERGFRHFGFAGQPAHAYSNRREASFRATIESAGFVVVSYREREAAFYPRGRLWAFDAAVRRWVAALPKPVGIFTPLDTWGFQLTEACRQENLRVPEDVAIVGVGNDDLLCGLSRPSLSSVAVPAERIGFEAAALLDRLMSRPRSKPSASTLLLPSPGVVTRRSSDTLSIGEEDVVTAVRFIRAQAHRPIQVDDVVEAVPLSRRSLELRFRTALGRSVWQEIRRAHMERARSLLSETDLPMSEVAKSAGFSDGKQLSVVFRQETGLTPSDYRRQFRFRGPGRPPPECHTEHC